MRPSRKGPTVDSMASMSDFAARARRVADQSFVRLDADQHGVALDDGPLASVKFQLQRFGERVGEQERSDARDLHSVHYKGKKMRKRHHRFRTIIPSLSNRSRSSKITRHPALSAAAAIASLELDGHQLSASVVGF